MRYCLICAAVLMSIGLYPQIGPGESFANSNTPLDGRFELDGAGYVKHWLIAEPEVKPHFEGRNESGKMSIDKLGWKAELPEKIAFDSPAPFGETWKYKQTGGDIYMQHHASATAPSAARMYAAVDLVAEDKTKVKARLRVGGWVNVWLNGRYLGQFNNRSSDLRLRLYRGRNRFVALIQNGGLRGIHFRVGLQLLEDTDEIYVMLPGPNSSTADFEQAEHWLSNLKVADGKRLVADTNPPFPVKVETGRRERTEIDWPQDRKEFVLAQDGAYMIDIEMQVHGHELERKFEIPSNFPIVQLDPDRPLAEHRREHLQYLAEGRSRWHNYFAQAIARKVLGEPAVYDSEGLDRALRRIDKRIDCADFDMAFAMRLYRLGAGTEEDRRRIKESALGFKHWRDEPGDDGMCYHSENHRLLFHSGQLISGNLWPDEIFTNSGKTGRQQAELGRKRCLEWLDELEAQGYHEFLSTTYAPITVGAVMNLVDFSDDAEISRRAALQMDKIYRMLALHSFDGIMSGPQGRSYRRILYPQILGTQALLSYATPAMVASSSPWTIFVASSPKYRPPEDLKRIAFTPAHKTYRESYYLIDLHKTDDYMLSSIEIPPSAKDPTFEDDGLQPGGGGYQQHIWHAMLARDCHVFTNHPGASRDLVDTRPSYWAGSKIMPRQTQRENILMQIFEIPEDHTIQFTHAYWPSDVFDRQVIRDHWIYGQKGDGYIGLWCSTKPQFHSEVLTDRELRAYGCETAWVCVCSSKAESGDFGSFMSSCKDLDPDFSSRRLRLELKGHKPMYYDPDKE